MHLRANANINGHLTTTCIPHVKKANQKQTIHENNIHARNTDRNQPHDLPLTAPCPERLFRFLWRPYARRHCQSEHRGPPRSQSVYEIIKTRFDLSGVCIGGCVFNVMISVRVLVYGTNTETISPNTVTSKKILRSLPDLVQSYCCGRERAREGGGKGNGKEDSKKAKWRWWWRGVAYLYIHVREISANFTNQPLFTSDALPVNKKKVE